MLIRSLIRMGFSKLIVPVQGKMQAKKKGDFDIKTLKKEFEIIKQNKLKDPDMIYDEIPHREVYRKMNTSIEAFFNKRSFTIQNFNFLLNIIAQQKKAHQIDQVLELMKSLNIFPTEETYNYIIRAWAIAGNLQKAEQTFSNYKKKFQPTKHAYNSMMIVYKQRSLCEKADQLLREMEENDLVPDLAIFTTLINTHHKSRNLKRCWELHKVVEKRGFILDQPYIGMMMTVYSSTHDVEKAINLYEKHIKDSKQLPYIETVNAYMKALASRADYSERAINYFFMMISKGQYINKSTITSVLKACANLGHVKDAANVVKIMRQKNIQPDEYIYNSLFRCYAGGVSLPNIAEPTVQLFIADAWRLLDEVSKKKLVNVTILNSLMLIFIQALKTEELDGLVLPLYKKYGIEMNEFSYEQLMKFLAKKDDVIGIEKMWDAQLEYLQKKKKQFLENNNNNQQKLNNAIKRGEFLPTFNSVCLHLESGIKLQDMDKIIQSLRLIKQTGRYPKFSHLKYLGQLKNLPVEIKAELVQYEVRFGELKGEKKVVAWRKKKKEYRDPQDR